MENFTTLKDAQIVDVNGLVQTGSPQDTALQIGESLTSGTVLTLAQGSEITLIFEDGTEQKITGAPDEILATNDQISQQASTLTPSQTLNRETPDNVQADIDAIQASIAAGDDVELPDTTAGGLTGNEGTDFVTLDRQGNELLASAGFETAELDNPPATTEVPEPFARGSQPTITQSDTNTVAEDNIANGNVLTNDSDADDDLTVQSFTVAGDPAIYTSGQTAIVENGTLLLNQDGSYSFTPADNFNGVLPVVTYTTNTNATDTLTINITPVSDLTDDNETVSIAENLSVTGNVLTNAASADGTPVVSDFTVNGTTFAVGETAELTEGDLIVNDDGSYSFVPADNFNGEVPVVTYTVSDGINTDTSTLTLDITPVSDLSDGNETVSIAEDFSVTGNVLTNAASADGTPVVSDFTVNGTTFAVGEMAELTEGDLSVNEDGSYSFVPADDFNGDVPIVTYTVSDGVNTDTSTLTINVTPVSDLSDGNESVSTPEDTSITGSVLTNAVSADGTPVVSDFTVDGTTYLAGETAKLDEGDFILSETGDYTFAPADNYNGPVPDVTYTVSDGVNTETSTLRLAVTPESDLSDGNEIETTPEDTTIIVNALANAASADGTPAVLDFTVGDTTFGIGDTATLDEGGLTLNADSTFTFVPADNYNGPVPDVTYTVSDGVNTNVSTLTVDVTPVNDAPVATDDSFSVNEGGTVGNNVIKNTVSEDTDGGDGNTLSVTQVNGVDLVFGTDGFAELAIKDGVLRINAQGEFTYANDGTEPAGDAPSFTYTLDDGAALNSESNEASVTIDVNDLPEAVADTFSMNEGKTLSGNVMDNDTDRGDGPATVTQIKGGSVTFDLTFDAADDDYATFTIIDGVYTAVSSTDVLVFDGATDNGILRINADGDFTYENKGFLADSDAPTFEYTLSDTDGDTSKATVTIGVATSAPDANDDATGFVFSEDNPRTISGNVSGLGRSSSGDARDDFGLDSFGTPAVTQVKYTYLDENSVEQTVTKLLDASNTFTNPVSIVTDFGTLSIDNKGNYTFSQGAEQPIEPLVFNYTIQDGDTVNPETATADLTINITPPEAEGRKAPEPSAKAVEFDLDETSGTINTDFDPKAFINVNEVAFKYSPDLDDLSDILTAGHTGGLETYLAAMGEDESTMLDIDLAVALKGFQVDDAVVLEKGDANSEYAAFTTVTNGFLADGAMIISDTAEATSAPIAELDSQEFLS